MGSNDYYAILEEQVVGVYDLFRGDITQDHLVAILKPFIGSDIDYGGSKKLKTFDGLDLYDVVIKIMRPNLWENVLDSVYGDDATLVINQAWVEIIGMHNV